MFLKRAGDILPGELVLTCESGSTLPAAHVVKSAIKIQPQIVEISFDDEARGSVAHVDDLLLTTKGIH